jgi:hypothetical protein
MIVELSSNFRMKNFKILTEGPGRKNFKTGYTYPESADSFKCFMF